MNIYATLAILVLLLIDVVFRVDIWRLCSYRDRLLRQREHWDRDHPLSEYPIWQYTGRQCPSCGRTKPRNLNGLCLDCVKAAMGPAKDNRVDAAKEWFRKHCHGTPIGTPTAWAELKDAIALRSEP